MRRPARWPRHAGAGSPARPGRAAAGVRLRGALRVAEPGGRWRHGDRVLADPRGAPGVTFGLAEFIAAEEMGRHARLLVGPGRLGPAGGPGGRDAGEPVAHRRPAPPRTPARRGGLSRGRHPERRRVLPWPGWSGPSVAVEAGPGRLPVPGHRLLAGRARPAGRGAEPGPADACGCCRRRRRHAARPPCCTRTPTRTGWRSSPACRPGPRTAGSCGPATSRTPAAWCCWRRAGSTVEPVTPPGLQVRGVLDVDGDTVLFQASQEPAEVGLWSYGPGGLSRAGAGRRRGRRHPRRRHDGQLGARSLDDDGVTVRVRRGGGAGRRHRLAGRAPGAARAPAGPVPGRARARSRPPCCSRPGTSPGRASCRCCSTRTAGRTRSGWSGPAAPTWSRSGSPSRGSRW